MNQDPVSIGEVVHLYSFENIGNRIETPLLMQVAFGCCNTTQTIMQVASKSKATT